VIYLVNVAEIVEVALSPGKNTLIVHVHMGQGTVISATKKICQFYFLVDPCLNQNALPIGQKSIVQ
jgi:hypothetical protein